jgi:hypothetical protein
MRSLGASGSNREAESTDAPERTLASSGSCHRAKAAALH